MFVYKFLEKALNTLSLLMVFQLFLTILNTQRQVPVRALILYDLCICYCKSLEKKYGQRCLTCQMLKLSLY